MKKTFLARIEPFVFCVSTSVCYSVVLIVFAIEVNKYICVFGINLLIVWLFGFSFGYNVIKFKADCIVYKRNLFLRKYKIPYYCIKKIFIDYTGYTVSRYKGAKPRIVLFFNDGKIAVNIRYGILWNLIKNKTKQCSVKIVFCSYSLCPENHRELLEDFLTQKQKREIEKLIAKK